MQNSPRCPRACVEIVSELSASIDPKRKTSRLKKSRVSCHSSGAGCVHYFFSAPLCHRNPDARRLGDGTAPHSRHTRGVTFHCLFQQQQEKKSYKTRTPDVYRGKSLDEWRTFTSSWEMVFRAQPWTYNRHSVRVNVAASSLRDSAHDAWEAAQKADPPLCRIHWESFKAFLADMIAAPQARQQEAFQALRGLEQLPGESVSELHARMRSFEADCHPPRTPAERVQTLDAALQDQEVKKQLASMLHGQYAKTVAHWLEQAQKAESLVHPKVKKGKTGGSSRGNYALKDPGSADLTQRERRKKKERFRNRRDNASGDSTGPSRSLPRPGSTAEIVCFTCGQKGHYANNAKCPKYGEWAKQNPERAKAMEDSRNLQRQVNEITQSEKSRSSSVKDSGKGKAKS